MAMAMLVLSVISVMVGVNVLALTAAMVGLMLRSSGRDRKKEDDHRVAADQGCDDLKRRQIEIDDARATWQTDRVDHAKKQDTEDKENRA
jgi:hypothetical protein